jgi:hypothetical protein
MERGRTLTFDLNYSNPETNFKTYVKKTGKGKFQMLEITDPADDKTEKRNWLKYEL